MSDINADLRKRIDSYLRQLAPHMRQREGVLLLQEAAHAIPEAVARERERCELTVFAIRMAATAEDAPNEGVDGWLKIAEDAIRARVTN